MPRYTLLGEVANEKQSVNQNMFVEGVLPGAIVRKLSEEEMNAYREPFLNPAHRKPVVRHQPL